MMKKRNILTILLLFAATTMMGQLFVTKNGFIKFYSDAPLEKIKAVNNQVNTALNTETGDFVFKVLMKSFTFEKALMQEHFNENYVESDKFPNATFLGKVTNLGEIDFSKAGSYNAIAEGKLTMHGVTKTVKEKGTLTVGNGKIMAIAVFPLRLSDYEVKIPSVTADKISETVEITVEVTLDPMKQD